MRIRRTARVVVVNERQQVLHFHYEDAIALDPTQPDVTERFSALISRFPVV